MIVPFHPLIVHFPLILICILPVLILIFAYMIRVNKMSPSSWLIIVGLLFVTTITGYVSLESGEEEEDRVEKVLDKKYIQAHESKAEVFVGVTVLALVFSIGAFFIKKDFQVQLQLLVAITALVAVYFGYQTGHLGGQLVYVHGAAAAYTHPTSGEEGHGILPTPGINTSESNHPVETNESFKSDENDYGNDDTPESDEEDVKQED